MDEEKRFQVGVGHFDGYNYIQDIVPARITSSLSSDIDWAVGFQAGYGNLSLALSKKIKGQGKDDYFSFDYLAAGFGGGYSFNLVPYHRQPTGDRDKGLRNLTIFARTRTMASESPSGSTLGAMNRVCAVPMTALRLMQAKSRALLRSFRA